MRVLIAEDSPVLQASLAQALGEAGYAVDVTGDGARALINARTTSYDVVVLDIMLPRMDGLEVLRQMRANRVNSCVLMLTARDGIDDRVRGLRAGADDYLVKPFALEELLARVASLARRAHAVAAPVIRVGNLEVDTGARLARAADDPPRVIDLAPREYTLLEYLAHRAGKPVARAEIEEHVYDERSQVMSNAVDVAVSSLRAKLREAGCDGLIHTRRKFGYMLSENAA
ncbi:MAG: response regulator transcription factor [Phycisphaerales bacterium]